MSDRSIEVFDSQGEKYDHAFRVFLNHTNQKRKAREWLAQRIEKLETRGLVVDVGAGNGVLTAWLSENFEDTIAIEPNRTLFADLKKACPKAEVVPDFIWDFKLQPVADFVVCSHVLYYIEDERWAEALDKMGEWLSPTGVVAVALQNPNSDGMKMVKHFANRTFDLRGAVAKMKGKFKTSFEVVPSEIEAPDLQTAFHVSEFVLNVTPNAHPPTESKIKEYLEANFKTPTGGYRFNVNQDFLVIQR